jgi:S1-C subfamily serine protease
MHPKSCAAGFMFAFAFANLLISDAHGFDIPDLAAKAKPSVLLLSCTGPTGQKTSSGTGFFVTSSGRIVTNYHVAKDCSGITATTSRGDKILVESVLAWDPKEDIAILQARGTDFPALAFGISADVREGQDVAVIGSPLGLSATVSVGIVSAIRTDGLAKQDVGSNDADDGHSWGLQVTAAISPGSSGSPIMDAQGKVIGVAVGNMRGGQNLNFGILSAVPMRMLAALSEGQSPLVTFRSQENRTRTNLVISAVFFGLPLGLYLGWRLLTKSRKRPVVRH